MRKQQWRIKVEDQDWTKPFFGRGGGGNPLAMFKSKTWTINPYFKSIVNNKDPEAIRFQHPLTNHLVSDQELKILQFQCYTHSVAHRERERERELFMLTVPWGRTHQVQCTYCKPSQQQSRAVFPTFLLASLHLSQNSLVLETPTDPPPRGAPQTCRIRIKPTSKQRPRCIIWK